MYSEEENKKYIQEIKNNREFMKYAKKHEAYIEVEKHLGEIIIDEDRRCKLLVGLDVDIIDFAYIYWDGENLSGLSAVGRPIYLKNKIDEEDYENLKNNFIYNSEPYYCYELEVEKWSENSLFLIKYEEKFETFIDEMIKYYCEKNDLELPNNKEEFLKIKERIEKS